MGVVSVQMVSNLWEEMKSREPLYTEMRPRDKDYEASKTQKKEPVGQEENMNANR